MKNECRLIYRQAFNDADTEFEDLLFEYCFPDCRVLGKDGAVASMLFALPCDIEKEGRKLNSAYIYAVATREAMRGKGYMSELIGRLKSEAYDLIFLRPASDSLKEYYKKLGFKEIRTENTTKKAPQVIPTESFKALISKMDLADGNEDFPLMYYSNSGEALEKLYFIYSME